MVLCPCRAPGIDITGQWGSEEIYPLTLSLTHTGEGHGQADIDRDGNKDRHTSGIKWAGLSNGEATASWELRGYIRYSLTGRQSYFLQLNKEAGLSLKGKQRGRKMIYSWTKRPVCITLLLEVSTGEESSEYKHPEHTLSTYTQGTEETMSSPWGWVIGTWHACAHGNSTYSITLSSFPMLHIYTLACNNWTWTIECIL